MPHTGCKITCNRPWSSLKGGRRKRTLSKPHQGRSYEVMEAATQARELQEEARRLYELKCQEAAEAETVCNEAIKDTLEETEALEKRVKTVTMRAESLATTEADFFQTLLECQEETQRNLQELSAQLFRTCAPQSHARAHAKHEVRFVPKKVESQLQLQTAVPNIHEGMGRFPSAQNSCVKNFPAHVATDHSHLPKALAENTLSSFSISGKLISCYIAFSALGCSLRVRTVKILGTAWKVRCVQASSDMFPIAKVMRLLPSFSW